MNTLISTSTLFEQLDAQDVFIIDCRFSLGDIAAGPASFLAGHIPGACYINLNEELSAPVVAGKTGRHPLPTREQFAATLGRLGVPQDARIVAYDDASGAFAARLWWMLRWLGHAEAAVLDGGYKAWLEAGYPESTESTDRAPTQFALKPPITREVTADEAANAPGLLLDARDRGRFLGQNETIDPVAGHIPGAINAPFMENLAAGPKMKSAEALRQQYSALGISQDSDVICYCGSGVTAAHDILAMVHAGFDEPALYPGSWSEWITDPTRRPVETDGG